VPRQVRVLAFHYFVAVSSTDLLEALENFDPSPIV
jgi:hypothetical protein